MCLETVRLDGQAGIKVSVEDMSLQREFKWTGSNGVHIQILASIRDMKTEDYFEDR